ncbi:Hypothetical_protein [Hexamita inflata]|uniref:Hypothetical_protein n=1 Tax=Hexamita inflata TaxID=28002 RepID=A0AA86U3S1_9EUKA|nr:Hypothetical protein HINF_LOCUS28845 [Hexamita inflata]
MFSLNQYYTKQCITACPATIPYYQTGACVSKCSTSAYSLVGSVLTCQTSCKFYILNATNGNTKQCFASCTGPLRIRRQVFAPGVAIPSFPEYQPVNPPSKLYVISVTNNNSKQCVTTCTTALVRSECQPNCMSFAVKTTLIVVVPLVTVVIAVIQKFNKFNVSTFQVMFLSIGIGMVFILLYTTFEKVYYICRFQPQRDYKSNQILFILLLRQICTLIRCKYVNIPDLENLVNLSGRNKTFQSLEERIY